MRSQTCGNFLGEKSGGETKRSGAYFTALITALVTTNRIEKGAGRGGSAREQWHLLPGTWVFCEVLVACNAGWGRECGMHS